MGNNNAWSQPTSTEAMKRRAGGRRRYNAHRSFLRMLRRGKVILLLGKYGLQTHGALTIIARQLNVTRSTICRDRKAIIAAWLASRR